MPFLDMVPEPLKHPRMRRADAAEAVARWLPHDDRIEIVADWPEDIAQFSMLLITGPGDMVRYRRNHVPHGPPRRLLAAPPTARSPTTRCTMRGHLRTHLLGLEP